MERKDIVTMKGQPLTLIGREIAIGENGVTFSLSLTISPWIFE